MVKLKSNVSGTCFAFVIRKDFDDSEEHVSEELVFSSLVTRLLGLVDLCDPKVMQAVAQLLRGLPMLRRSDLQGAVRLRCNPSVLQDR
jgi:hypothetical protein